MNKQYSTPLAMLSFGLLLTVLHAAQAFTLVSDSAKARIVVGADEPEPVYLAAVDLTNDVKRISGADLELKRGTSAAKGDVFIATTRDGRWEAYSVKEFDGYPYYHDVVNHGAMARVAEALVRSRMNMIIPASFLNISPSARTTAAERSGRRGTAAARRFRRRRS
ncbi:MAG: hypothetical protein MJ249_10665 [Kiritimatiellae bacterium]|nr:hypothetical protein [Kiritimatiellia bacterium]